MRTYETSATVEAEGEVRLAGVPFAPGTEVDVTISLKRNGAQSPVPGTPDRVARLFAALDRARNVQPLGVFKRDELYDRNVLH